MLLRPIYRHFGKERTMIAAVVIGICAVALLLTLRARPACAPPGQVGMHGALVARRH